MREDTRTICLQHTKKPKRRAARSGRRFHDGTSSSVGAAARLGAQPSGQLELRLPRGWGGARAGAGRKPNAGRGNVAHRPRPQHRAAEPVHVTLRALVRSLRAQFVFPTVRRAVRDANRRWRGRWAVVHFSVQADHLHLLVEARDSRSLSRAMQGLAISLARRLNRLLFRRGRVFAERWHGRALTSPRAVRHGLAYVLGNFRKHGEPAAPLDRCSSAPYFRYFTELGGRAPVELAHLAFPDDRTHGPPVRPAATWLLAHGWRQRGDLSLHEVPAAKRVAARARASRARRPNRASHQDR